LDASNAALTPGCEVRGVARLVPNVAMGRSWLLKLQPKAFTQDCAKRTPIASIRASYLQNLSGLNSDAKALVAGLSIGDTSLLSTQTSDQMKVLSLTHLTAVSGANCAIVLGLVLFLLRKFRIPRHLRTASSFGFLAFYLLLVGYQPSVFRAAFMSIVIMVLVTTGRSIGPIPALGWATCGLLVLNPAFAADYGFALSVAATAGILVLTPWLFNILRTRLPKWLAISFAVSASAQLLCAPILLQLQSGIPTYSLLANVLVEPLVVPITVLGLLACLAAVCGLTFWCHRFLGWQAFPQLSLSPS